MTVIDIDAFQKAGFTFEEIQKIIKSQEDFERTGISYSHEEVKKMARKELFSNAKVHV